MNETVIHVAHVPAYNCLLEDDYKVTFGDIKNYLLLDDPDQPNSKLWKYTLWTLNDSKKLYSLSDVAFFVVAHRYSKKWENKNSQEHIEFLDKQLNSTRQHIMYEKKLEEENEKALHYIRDYPGTLSFDMYNRKWLRRMSISHCTKVYQEKNLVLRVHFVAQYYEIPFRPENKDAKNPMWVLCNTKDASIDGGNNSNNENVKFEIKSLCQEGDYFTLNYKLRRCYNNLTNFKSRSTQLQKHEEKNSIFFVKPRHDFFPQHLKCWFPHAGNVNKMDAEAVEAQTDHEYFIMAMKCGPINAL